jgi:hypothetical protein
MLNGQHCGEYQTAAAIFFVAAALTVILTNFLNYSDGRGANYGVTSMPEHEVIQSKEQ